MYNIPSEVLSKTIFPLAQFSSKDEIRQIAAKNNLPSKSAKDSQDVCFIQNVEKIGTHDGAAKYTAGQRKGIGIAYKEPLYVVKTDVSKNIVYVGVKKDTCSREVNISAVNMHDKNAGNNFIADIKIRYNMKTETGTVELTSGNCAKIVFENPVNGVAKGQAAVFYDKNDGHLIGGGIIL